MIGAMLREASAAMRVNRTRTLLTMLGMVIGVGAVIVMTAIGSGAQLQVDESIASMGSNLLVVLSGGASSNGVRISTGSVPTLTLADADAIAELPAIAAVAPVQPGSAQVVYGAANWNTPVMGSTPSFLTIRAWDLAAGSTFGASDVRTATRVAVLGQTVATNLFGDDDPIGKTIRIRQSPFVVVGVLAAKGQSLNGQDQDDVILIPVSTAQRKLFGNQFPGTVRFIMAQAQSAELINSAQRQISELLRQRHHLRDAADNDFDVRNLTAIANTAAETSRAMTLMLGAIASISLIVGGIGIMNIMLVSVTERTREIGIRMAIGARARDVLTQFLLEAVIISVIGCGAGIVLGIVAALLINALADMAVVITAASALLAFAVAASVGVFFGFYPARKAAHLKPIEALRYQ